MSFFDVGCKRKTISAGIKRKRSTKKLVSRKRTLPMDSSNVDENEASNNEEEDGYKTDNEDLQINDVDPSKVEADNGISLSIKTEAILRMKEEGLSPTDNDFHEAAGLLGKVRY
jgi:hypothetical protein